MKCRLKSAKVVWNFSAGRMKLLKISSWSITPCLFRRLRFIAISSSVISEAFSLSKNSISCARDAVEDFLSFSSSKFILFVWTSLCKSLSIGGDISSPISVSVLTTISSDIPGTISLCVPRRTFFVKYPDGDPHPILLRDRIWLLQTRHSPA